MINQRNIRQSFLGPDSDKVIRETTVAIVGLCGGGSHIAQQLAHIGVGTIIGIDPDHVEESNLHRMVGSRPRDATEKRMKTDVIGELVAAINPRVTFLSRNSKWQDATLDLNTCSCIFGCIDSFSHRNQLEAYSRRFLIPYIDIGMDVTKIGDNFYITGQVIIALPGRPCMQCMGFLTPELLTEEAARYGDVGGKPQVIWPNGTLASIAVGQLMQLITPWSDSKVALYLEYDGNRQMVIPSARTPYFENKTCPHYPLDAVGDPFWTGITKSP